METFTFLSCRLIELLTSYRLGSSSFATQFPCLGLRKLRRDRRIKCCAICRCLTHTSSPSLSLSLAVSLLLSSARFHVFDLSWQPLTAVNRTLWPQLAAAASAGIFTFCRLSTLRFSLSLHDETLPHDRRISSWERDSETGTAHRKRWAIGKCKLPACVALSTSLRQR